jgi:hypothetical protein
MNLKFKPRIKLKYDTFKQVFYIENVNKKSQLINFSKYFIGPKTFFTGHLSFLLDVFSILQDKVKLCYWKNTFQPEIK